jgi:hypothetical protein
VRFVPDSVRMLREVLSLRANSHVMPHRKREESQSR